MSGSAPAGAWTKTRSWTCPRPSPTWPTRGWCWSGLSGDLLDLLVALAPCVVGYGEIGARLMAEHGAGLSNNPYREWVETYAGEDYQAVVRSAIEQLDRVAHRRAGVVTPESPRWQSLATTFRAATRLEAGFWEMGLNAVNGGPGRPC